MNSLGSNTGPRALDPHVCLRISSETLAAYRLAASRFCAWCDLHNFNPIHAEEWDDLLIDYKNSARLTKSQFAYVIAAVEFMFPRFKGHLCWCYSARKGWDIANPTKRAVSLLPAPASVLATHLAVMGYAHIGGGLLV